MPSLRLNTVANWFDITGGCAHRELNNREMLEFGHKVQMTRNALARICDSREYRPSDYTHIDQRLKQLENLLPTQDLRITLPDEGDFLGSEIFDSNSVTLSPSLLAWYGEHPQEGQNSSIFLVGRAFSVGETRVIAGGVDVPDAQKRMISRNVMEIVIPSNARVYKHQCVADRQHEEPAPGGANAPNPDPNLALNPDPTRPLNPDPAIPLNPDQNGFRDVTRPLNPVPGLPLNTLLNPDPNRPLNPDPRRKWKPAKSCGWAVIDVHIATPNGVSNHHFVEPDPKASPTPVKEVEMTATTTTTHNGGVVTTATKLVTTPPGIPLPAMTILPLGTQWPMNTVMAPGAVNGAPAGSIFPGMIPPSTPAPERSGRRAQPDRSRGHAARTSAWPDLAPCCTRSTHISARTRALGGTGRRADSRRGVGSAIGWSSDCRGGRRSPRANRWRSRPRGRRVCGVRGRGDPRT